MYITPKSLSFDVSDWGGSSTVAGKGTDLWGCKQMRVPPNGGPLLRLTSCGLDGGPVRWDSPWPMAVKGCRLSPSRPEVKIRAKGRRWEMGGSRDPQPRAAPACAPGSCESLAAAISQLFGERK